MSDTNKKLLNTKVENDQKGIEKMTNIVLKNIYDNNPENIKFKVAVNRITGMYYVLKDIFFEKYRDDWERYFEHLREVALLVLEMENPTLDKVLIALAHDVIEDFKIKYSTLEDFYWKKVAISVLALSKKDFSLYLNEEEKEEFTKLEDNNDVLSDKYLRLKAIWKERRNEEYFGHLKSFESMKEYIIELSVAYNLDFTDEEIDEVTKYVIDVKLADKIHNLSTQWDENNIEKVEKNIWITKKYFYDISKEVNIKAHNKIKSLVLKLELQLEWFKERTLSIIE